MGLELEHRFGQTPLDDDEREGLRIATITTKEELDEFEQLNIEQAMQWSLTKHFTQQQIFSEAFVKQVHHKMFGEVWTWAGTFRTTNKNIGVDKWEISTELKKLLDDGKFWIDHHVYAPDETAIRFKHRLVSIHCFANGNGRHSRLMADIIIEKIFKQPVFTWGDRTKRSDVRARYLRALKAADGGEMGELIEFARL